MENHQGVEWVVSRPRRNWLVIPFLAFWLTAWSFGGVAAIMTLFNGTQFAGERLFMMVWLVGWALGWVFAASWLGWQLSGKMQLTVQAGALEYRWQMALISKSRRYDAREVRHLRPATMGWPWGMGGFFQPSYPPFFPMNPGSVRFDYGGRAINVMPGLDEAEGRAISDWLARRLPGGARPEASLPLGSS